MGDQKADVNIVIAGDESKLREAIKEAKEQLGELARAALPQIVGHALPLFERALDLRARLCSAFAQHEPRAFGAQCGPLPQQRELLPHPSSNGFDELLVTDLTRDHRPNHSPIARSESTARADASLEGWCAPSFY